MTKSELEQLLDLRKEIQELDAKVEKMQGQRVGKVMEFKISQYINGINDSRIRRIISLRYEEGLSWDKVAAAMNCDRTYPEKLLTKYLKEHPEKKKRKKMKLSHNSHFK